MRIGGAQAKLRLGTFELLPESRQGMMPENGAAELRGERRPILRQNP